MQWLVVSGQWSVVSTGRRCAAGRVCGGSEGQAGDWGGGGGGGGRLQGFAVRGLAERVTLGGLGQWTLFAGGARFCGARFCGGRFCGARFCGGRFCGGRFCGGRCGGCPPAQGKPLAADRPKGEEKGERSEEGGGSTRRAGMNGARFRLPQGDSIESWNEFLLTAPDLDGA